MSMAFLVLLQDASLQFWLRTEEDISNDSMASGLLKPLIALRKVRSLPVTLWPSYCVCYFLGLHVGWSARKDLSSKAL